MTSRSLNIINDTQRNLSGTQLRSNVVPIIELIGKQQTIVNGTETQVTYSEIMRQSGTEDVNYVWPVPTSFARLPSEYRWYLVQVTSSGYYSFTFQYTFSQITEVYARLNVYDDGVENPEFNQVIRFFSQLLPVASSGSVTWTQYINAREVVSVSLNSAANIFVLPSTNMFSPSLTIVQLSQFYTNTIGYKSTIAKNTTTQTFTSGTLAAFIGDSIPGASSVIDTTYFTSIWYNEGGGNQLGGIPSTYDAIKIDRNLTGHYYIEAQITITGTTGVGIGARYAIIYDGVNVLASKFIDPLNSGERSINVCTVEYIPVATISGISVQVLQTSGVGQTTIAALCHLTLIRLGD
jgi:hypothetical protein